MIEAVDRGEEVTLIRDGVAIARVVPGRRATADQIAEVIENNPLPPEAVDEWKNAIKEVTTRYPVDPGWADELEAVVREAHVAGRVMVETIRVS